MSKRTSNKKAKQMIADVVLQGRKAFWHGDETEVFAAKSFEQLNDEFGVEKFPDDEGNLVAVSWKYWWKTCVSEKEWCHKKGKYITKGQSIYGRNGELIQEHESLPLICGVYGGADDVAQVLTSHKI